MRHSDVRNKYLVILFAALQFHAIPVGRDGDQIGNLDLKAALFSLEYDAPVRYVEYPPVGFVLHVVRNIGCPAAIVVFDVLEENAGISCSMAATDIPLVYNLFSYGALSM